VGFTTYTGTVTAANDWDEPPERKQIVPALTGSIEALLHGVGFSDFVLPLRGRAPLAAVLAAPLLQRAIGVIYRPRTERASHYFEARVPEQFDAIVHLDRTEAVEPLDLSPGWKRAGEVPETYPSGV
jgi:erythromycin esterase-like protein